MIAGNICPHCGGNGGYYIPHEDFTPLKQLPLEGIKAVFLICELCNGTKKVLDTAYLNFAGEPISKNCPGAFAYMIEKDCPKCINNENKKNEIL